MTRASAPVTRAPCIDPCASFPCLYSNPITVVQYSSTGDRVLAASASSRLKVFDRDGVELAETLRGDMYLVDMKRTKGHVSGINGAAWHPKVKEEFLTCASDG